MSDVLNQKERSRLRRLGLFILTLCTAALYRVEFDKHCSSKSLMNKQLQSVNSVRFRFHPRKEVFFVMYTLTAPIMILIVGVVGLVKSIRSSVQVQDFSSYKFTYRNGVEAKQVTKWNAYKKF